MKTKKVITATCWVGGELDKSGVTDRFFQITIGAIIGVWLFEGFPALNMLFALAAQFAHLLVLRDYPMFHFSVESIATIILFAVNNYLTLAFFSEQLLIPSGVDFSIFQIFSYFLVCIWLVPLALFISLTANENMLPMTNDTSQNGFNGNLPGGYYNQRKSGKYSLKNAMDYVKDNFLPAFAVSTHKNY